MSTAWATSASLMCIIVASTTIIKAVQLPSSGMNPRCQSRRSSCARLYNFTTSEFGKVDPAAPRLCHGWPGQFARHHKTVSTTSLHISVQITKRARYTSVCLYLLMFGSKKCIFFVRGYIYIYIYMFVCLLFNYLMFLSICS